MTNPQKDLEVNVQAQLALLESCRQLDHPPRIVFASTRQIYGKPAYLPVDEAHPLEPVDINGIHKITGEMYHQLYGRVFDIPVTILRLTNTYGPRMRVKDDRQTFLGTWIQRLLDDEPLLVFGDGSQLRDFNYVDDVTDALLHCAAADQAIGRIYNLGSTEVISLEKLAQMMVSLRDGGYELVTFPGERKRIDIGDYYSDFSKIDRDIGWQPATGLEEGLATTIDYFAQHRQHYWP